MTNFNRRMFMSLAGIAAAEPAMSLLGSAETRTSALPEVQTGNGEWTYEVVRGGDRCPRERALERLMAPSGRTMRATSISAHKVQPECSSITAMEDCDEPG
jgi:hypothetical protein